MAQCSITAFVPSTSSRSEFASAQKQSGQSVFIHPQAICESDAIGEGTRIWAFAHVMRGAQIGCDCNIGGHAFIEAGAIIGNRVTIKNGALIWNGVTIEDDAFIGPGVIFTNDHHPRSPRGEYARERYTDTKNWLEKTCVHRGASIGAGAIILCGTQIGAYATIGAGTVVTRDIAAQRLALGNPSREVGWVCRCGHPLNETVNCTQCHQKYRLAANNLVAAD